MMQQEEKQPRWGESLELIGEAVSAGRKTPEDVQEYMLAFHSTMLSQKAIKALLKQAEKESKDFWSHCHARAFDTAQGRPAELATY